MPTTADDLEYRIAQAAADIRHAATDHEWPHFHLSNALDSITRATSSYHRISGRQRDILLNELIHVRDRAAELFPDPALDLTVLKGVDAFAAIIMNWSDGDDVRALRPADQMADIRAYARILQNLSHNASLLAEVRERAGKRIEKAVRNVMVMATQVRGLHDARSVTGSP